MSKKTKPEQGEKIEQEQPASEEATGQPSGAETQEAGESEAKGMEQEFAEVKAEAARNWDLYLRAQADLENYRKRAQREKEELGKFANENIIREILPVMDNLERALDHAESSGTDGLVEGVQMTLNQFRKVLEKFGVTPIEAVGQPFDPAHHEAMGQMETSEFPPNSVAQEMQRGYLLNSRLLRPSMVMIAREAPEGEKKSSED